jgi:hypothetical protein
MKRALVVLTLIVLLAGLLSAEPPEVRNAAALALIPFSWQQLHYEIVFRPPQQGIRAMIFERERRIEVYARPSDDSHRIAYDIAHELGHAIDFTFNSAESRRKWLLLRGIDPATPWFGCNRCGDYETPAGDFAETFALYLFGPGHFNGRIAPPPTEDELTALKPFFEYQPLSVVGIR